MSNMQNQVQAAGVGPAGAVSGDARVMMMYQAGQKSLLVSYLLWFFLGGLAGHRFYNGKIGSALTQIALLILAFIVTIGGVASIGAHGSASGALVGVLLAFGVGLWVLVDAFLIPGWVRRNNEMLAGRLSGM